MLPDDFFSALLVDHEYKVLTCVTNVEQYLKQQYCDGELKVDDFCKAVHMSESTLRRKCLKIFGIPPSELLLRYRIEVAKSLLKEGLAVGDVAGEVGFSTHAHFSTQFKRFVGITPQNYQKAAKLTE